MVAGAGLRNLTAGVWKSFNNITCQDWEMPPFPLPHFHLRDCCTSGQCGLHGDPKVAGVTLL